MTKQEKAGVLIGAGLIMGITMYSAWKLVGTGILSWHVKQPELVFMVIELLMIGSLLTGLLFFGKTWGLRIGGLVVLAGLFSWFHMLFLPMMLSGLYVLYLMMLGTWMAACLGRKRISITWTFVLGMAGTIMVFCLLSLFQIGSIFALRCWVLGTGLFLGIWWFKVRWTGWNRTPQPLTFSTCLMLAGIGILLFLQMGRMNQAVDFDSLWYGTRSAVMLNSGTSIYENLGTLGVVYTYPKGFEVLTLPLAGLPSYSFPMAFNIWVTGLVLLAGFQAGCVSMKTKNALWIPFLMAAVPGIMNMAGTAKADMMTLFLQLLMLQGVLRYEKERTWEWLILGLCAGVVSLTMKPTAVVYSTAIVGMAVLWLLWEHLKKKGELPKKKARDPYPWVFFGITIISLIGIWGRTMKLVGVPITSVFYSAFQTLGFQVKYPFYVSGFPSAGSELSLGEAARFLLGRLYGILLNPQGEDMGHVIIAWGAVIPLAMVVVWLISIFIDANKKMSHFLPWLIPPILVVNLISLYSLSQIDGNYYMLTYGLLIIAGCMGMEEASLLTRRCLGVGLIPAWVYGALLCALTNWAWALGMGEIRLVNQGYYPHQKIAQERRIAQGSGAIWDILGSNPKNRVIALGEHPEVLTFPCSVQSYVDVSGYWGNPEVVANAEAFLAYLQYAKIDYLYMEKEYVDESVRIYQIIRTLVEQGWLIDVREEHGNLILTVEKGVADIRNAAENLEIFDTRYQQHP